MARWNSKVHWQFWVNYIQSWSLNLIWYKKVDNPWITGLPHTVSWLITPTHFFFFLQQIDWKSSDIKQILPFHQRKTNKNELECCKQSQWTIQGQRLHTHAAKANGNSSHHAQTCCGRCEWVCVWVCVCACVCVCESSMVGYDVTTKLGQPRLYLRILRNCGVEGKMYEIVWQFETCFSFWFWY